MCTVWPVTCKEPVYSCSMIWYITYDTVLLFVRPHCTPRGNCVRQCTPWSTGYGGEGRKTTMSRSWGRSGSKSYTMELRPGWGQSISAMGTRSWRVEAPPEGHRENRGDGVPLQPSTGWTVLCSPRHRLSVQSLTAHSASIIQKMVVRNQRCDAMRCNSRQL